MEKKMEKPMNGWGPRLEHTLEQTLDNLLLCFRFLKSHLQVGRQGGGQLELFGFDRPFHPMADLLASVYSAFIS